MSRLKDGHFTTVTSKDGLFDDFISRILEDERGNLWLLGNRGVFRISHQELNDFAEGRIGSITSTSYGVADGMKSSEGNGGFQPAGWKAADGKLWFPTLKGVAVFDPQERDELPPPVWIEQVMVDRTPSPSGQTAQLEPGQESLDIYYTALKFSRPEHIRFKYRLVGLDQSWVDAGTRRTAYYSHLPPGEYTFRVIAGDGEGLWNTEGQSLRVVVLPPFYRTWWFMALAALSVGALAFAFYRRRVNGLERARAAQQAFARQLINSQESERRRIAAELHDSLGQSLVIIRNWALLGLGQLPADAPAKEELDEISDTASRAINEVREIAYDLGPYHLDRLGLADTIKEMASRVAKSSGIRFSTDFDGCNTPLSREVETGLYRIAQECLNNIVKHSGATAAQVTMKCEAGGVRLTVADDGKGFEPHAAGSPGSDGGFGLAGMTERVRLLNGALSVRSAPGEGTRIEVTLNS